MSVSKDLMTYWRDGHAIVEARLDKAVKADPSDAPIPLTGEQAKLWHMAQADAYRDALEMMGVPESKRVFK